MSVSSMEKLTVIARKSDADAIMRRLTKLRAVSLRTAVADAADELPTAHLQTESAQKEAQARVARISAVLPQLQKRSTRRKSLFRAPLSISGEEFRHSERYDAAWKMVEETEKLLRRIAQLKTEVSELAAEMQALEPYLGVELRLDEVKTEKTVMFYGFLPASVKEERFLEIATAHPFVPHVCSADKLGLYVSILCHKNDEREVLSELSLVGFLKASFPHVDGTPHELYEAAATKKEKTEETIERHEGQLHALAGNTEEVEILFDVESTTAATERNKGQLLATDACAIFTLWCPTRQKTRVSNVLDGCSAAYSFELPAEGEDVPVLLHNNAYARNFEWVLGMYSYPQYGKYDPTFVMSIFYFIIFGLMFADAGYGLVLSLVCFGAVRWFRLREGMKRFLLMFGYCGISCIIFGVLFGAYFGNFPLAFMENVLRIPVDQMPNLALLPTDTANVALFFDPLQNPMAFLVVSLAIGAVHLIAGMAVKAVLLCREGKAFDALCDIVSYWVLFAGIGVIFLNKTAGFIVLGIGIAAVVLTQGRHAKNIGMKIAGGFLGLYDLINYASDLLSYSRILALGLAAGVIGQVVNILATIKGASFIGFLLLIVVFCVGHLLNLVINVLGTFVHTSRLQYIEFFSKFYEDGGTPFKPLVPVETYTEETGDTTSAT